MSVKVESEIYTAGGRLYKLSHVSEAIGAKMNVNVYLPKQHFAAAQSSTDTAAKRLPVLFYLSGLTCTPQNASEKGGIFPWADHYGIAIVLPDTSPRGLDIKGATDNWDFGEGASFYVNATKEPYSKNYQMHDYVLKELPQVLGANYPGLDFTNKSIFGHSMGGFGALIFFLRNPGEFRSVSAFAPISNPTNCPWGKKAFLGYLKNPESEQGAYDPVQLIKKFDVGKASESAGVNITSKILIHQGTADQFYKDKQLQPELLVEAAKESKLFKDQVELHLVDGFDHSYYFISTFVKDHLAHHAAALGV